MRIIKTISGTFRLELTRKEAERTLREERIPLTKQVLDDLAVFLLTEKSS